MLRWLALAVLAGVAGAGCSASGSARKLDARSAGAQISASLAATTGVPGPQVHCPAGVEVKAGQTFDCTMMLDGQPLTVHARLTDGKGRFTFVPASAILVVAKAAGAIKAQVDGQTDGQATVACGPHKVLIESPGQTFPCTAVAAAVTRTVTVTVSDLQGNVRFQLAPPSTGSPPTTSVAVTIPGA